jgi:hypothetical protein
MRSTPRKNGFGFLAVLYLSLLFSIQAGAESVTLKKYAIPGGSFVQLQVLTAWRETITKYEHQMYYDVTFWPPTGRDFRVIVSIAAPAPHRKRSPETEEIRQKSLEMMLSKRLPDCEEKELVSQKFSGEAGLGWFASLTNKHIKPGEKKQGQYRHEIFGTYLVNGDLLTFTLESHEKNTKLIDQMLEMLKSAKVVAE